MVNVQRSYVNVQKAYQMFGVYLDIFFIIMNRDWRNDKGFFIIKSFRLNKMFIYESSGFIIDMFLDIQALYRLRMEKIIYYFPDNCL